MSVSVPVPAAMPAAATATATASMKAIASSRDAVAAQVVERAASLLLTLGAHVRGDYVVHSLLTADAAGVAVLECTLPASAMRYCAPLLAREFGPRFKQHHSRIASSGLVVADGARSCLGPLERSSAYRFEVGFPPGASSSQSPPPPPLSIIVAPHTTSGSIFIHQHLEFAPVLFDWQLLTLSRTRVYMQAHPAVRHDAEGVDTSDATTMSGWFSRLMRRVQQRVFCLVPLPAGALAATVSGVSATNASATATATAAAAAMFPTMFFFQSNAADGGGGGGVNINTNTNNNNSNSNRPPTNHADGRDDHVDATATAPTHDNADAQQQQQQQQYDSGGAGSSLRHLLNHLQTMQQQPSASASASAVTLPAHVAMAHSMAMLHAAQLVSNGWTMDDMLTGRRGWVVGEWRRFRNEPHVFRKELRGGVASLQQPSELVRVHLPMHSLCPICHEHFAPSDIVVNLPCNHNFHAICVTATTPTRDGNATSMAQQRRSYHAPGTGAGRHGLCTWIASGKATCPCCRSAIAT